MTNPLSPLGAGLAQGAPAAPAKAGAEADDISRRFEQMLWAEMLSHAGLEKAFTQNGGEGASSFSRYLIEAIAQDISDKHPLGLGSAASALAYGASNIDASEKP